ncbi:HAD family hydrolase [Deinococcus sp.]|uniref:HAD family hydrolase n=1 Tax=Deinococcus sp. TaxID=47478 RepID=UPI00286E3395|nr:HAD family hydrolase [Deinococcus sp.]
MVTFSAVLFDLDGTLYDRAETVRRYLAGHVRRFDLPEGYAERWTVLDDLGYHSKPEVFPQLVAEFGLKHDPQVLLQDFGDHAWADCQLMPHSHEVLAELRQCGLKLGLVTNGWSEKQRQCMAGLGLADAFDTVIVSREVGCSKPEPRIYALALEQLGVQAAQTLFVGDSPLNDVAGPQSAGMKAALFPGGHAPPGHIRPDYVLTDLRGVLGIVEPAP